MNKIIHINLVRRVHNMALPSVQEVIVGNIGRVGELRELQNDNAVINFAIATNQRRREGNNWVEGETIWTNCVAWGREARALAAQNFPAGTELIVIGRRSATKRDAYTNKQGEQVPERVEQEVIVNSFGVSVNPFVNVTVTRLQKNGAQGGQSAPRPAAQPQQATPKPAAAPDPFGSPADVPDPFGSDLSSDPFADGGDPF